MVPIKATLFEDFIDGYFPLNVSLGHMLTRHGFSSAWILMRVAPMMEIPGLTVADPVPLHLNPAHGGQFNWLAATIQISDQVASLSGLAKWHWNDPTKVNEQKISANIRLSEPAFLWGVGFFNGDLTSQSLGGVRRSFDNSEISFVSADQMFQPTGKYKLIEDLGSGLLWRVDFSEGITCFKEEAIRPWGCTFKKGDSPRFQEGLFFQNADNKILSSIILDSLSVL